MIKIGITGGIGSGKSTVCQFFKTLGIPVFEADTEAKKLVNNSESIRNQLIVEFGSDIYLSNQTIDRKKLAGLIFNSPPLLEKVNQIIHPEVRAHFFRWFEMQKAPYVVHEAAILFESGFSELMDFTVLVTAPEQMRIERVMKREGCSAESVRARMAHQWTDEKKMQMADFVIQNNNKELLVPQLFKLDTQFRNHG